ncbi:MAG: DUF2283 domain-containing protein [Rhodocyclaceae bacterium]|nr:DUF2283 domain-containing protein [Rhodocyclaceae bacterium]
MKIEFDPLADALYVALAEEDVDATREVSPGVMLDLDRLGNVLGVEVLYVSKRESKSLPTPRAA